MNACGTVTRIRFVFLFIELGQPRLWWRRAGRYDQEE